MELAEKGRKKMRPEKVKEMTAADRKNRDREHGFTVIELAIVMVIIGLLIGVVIKGHSMIENARYKAVINQANDLTNAYHTYLHQYGKYPGDDNTAVNRWAASANGNNNGRIDAAEPFLANQHLALAGIITGTYNGTTQAIPIPRYSGNASFISAFEIAAAPFTGLQGLCTNVIRFTALPAEAAQTLDTALDDGTWNTGKVRADAAYTPDTTIANTALCL
ncbi:MAG TPA: prepilin-type N-terminal cleavage/methylation domain-containing protein [Syntrophorhabdaceae bacterium]|nr:prepilin-type N-terminal cleavage/methylation domain-containing protein [Syntrophorhabdaceae bacterium]